MNDLDLKNKIDVIDVAKKNSIEAKANFNNSSVLAENLNEKMLVWAMNSNNASLNLKEVWGFIGEEKNAIARNKYFAALAKAQLVIGAVLKTSKVDYGNRGGQRTKYNYFDLGGLTMAVREGLSANDLSHFFSIEQDKSIITVTANVCHAGGHRERVSANCDCSSMGSMSAIQQTGAAISYLSRYTLSCVLGVAGIEDKEEELHKNDDERRYQANSRNKEFVKRTTSSSTSVPPVIIEKVAVAKDCYPDDKFDANLDQWKLAIKNGKTPAELLTFMMNREVYFSEKQKNTILAL